MLPLLSPLTLPTAQSGTSGDPTGFAAALPADAQGHDFEGVSGDFEATLALLKDGLSDGVAGALASPALAGALTREGGQGVPAGGTPLPAAPGIPARVPGGAVTMSWQPGELLTLLAGGGVRPETGARPELPGVLTALASLGDGAGTTAGQGTAGLARLDGLLLELGATGGASARGPSAGGAQAAGGAAALLAGQAALIPDSPGFGQGLGQRLIAMVQQGLQHAQLRIHPEHLGPLEVRLRTEGDAVQVTLASPHASVREALEAALPRLRDALGEHGLSLAQADVGGGEREAAAQGEGDAEGTRGSRPVEGESDVPADSTGDGRLTPRAISLVDTFA